MSIVCTCHQQNPKLPKIYVSCHWTSQLLNCHSSVAIDVLIFDFPSVFNIVLTVCPRRWCLWVSMFGVFQKIFSLHLHAIRVTTSQQRFMWEWQKELLLKGKNVADFKMLQASLVAQMVKNPPTMQDTWVWSLGGEDPLERGMAAHSSILIHRESPGQRSPVGSMGLQRVRHDWATFTFTLQTEKITEEKMDR